jgi:nucleoside diphosphate kinase
VSTQKPVTVAIIKPDMISVNKKEEIVQKIKERGYELLEEKEIQFTDHMAREFYKEKENEVKSFILDYYFISILILIFFSLIKKKAAF